LQQDIQSHVVVTEARRWRMSSCVHGALSRRGSPQNWMDPNITRALRLGNLHSLIYSALLVPVIDSSIANDCTFNYLWKLGSRQFHIFFLLFVYPRLKLVVPIFILSAYVLRSCTEVIIIIRELPCAFSNYMYFSKPRSLYSVVPYTIRCWNNPENRYWDFASHGASVSSTLKN